MRRTITFLSFIFLYFLLCPELRPQTVTPKFDRLPAVIPQCVFQDSYGFIWIGDQEGLLRYDGYHLKRYKQIPFDTTSLSNNFVRDIKEDGKGNLWIATHGGGLNYFDQRTEKFTHYKHNPRAPNSLGGNAIVKIAVDDDGSLWISIFQNGFTHLSWDSAGHPVYTRNTSKEKSAPDIDHYGILDLYLDKQGFLWLGTVHFGLQRLNIASGEIKTYRHDPDDPTSIGHNMVSSICEDDSGNLWLGTGFSVFKSGAGLDKFDRKTELFTHYKHDPKDPYSVGSDIINSVIIDRENIMWIGTADNGLQYIPMKELLNNPKPRFRRFNYFGNYWINSLYQDKLGNVWIAASAFYVYKYDRKQNKFPHFKHEWNNPNSLSESDVASILIDKKENIWFGHGSTGLSKYNPGTGQYKHYYHQPDNPNSISENWITAICEDREGNIWIGTHARGIDILNPADDTFTHIKADAAYSTALFSNQIKWLLPSRTGDIYVSFNTNGMQLFNADENRFIQYDIDPNTVEDEDIRVLFEDSSGKLWIGTRSGLYKVTFKDRQIADTKHYIYNPRDKKSLSNNVIFDIIQTRVYDTSALWLATNGGLNRLDLQSGTFSSIQEKDGLSSNFVLKVLEDNSGNIWCTTSAGMSKYNPQTKKLINYSREDGLPTTAFGTGRANTAKGSDGRLYFCSGGGGVLAFDPAKIKDNPNIPPIRITDFKISHKSVRLDTAIRFKKRIILNHTQNAFSFEFAALDFTNPAKNRYAYKLEGFDDSWIYTATERIASFTNLDPGDYVFRVKGSNNHGLWNEKGASINIRILPPWWRTNFAYAGYILFIFLMLYALRKYDLKRQRLKTELELEHEHADKLEEIDRMKSRFFANISHEFRTPLTLILGPIEKLLGYFQQQNTANKNPATRIRYPEAASDLSMMQRNARRLQRLINQLLDLSRLESGGMTLQLSEENMVELVRQYAQSFESLAKSKGIKLTFRSQQHTIMALVDKDKIEKILNNLLSNAFKFTNKGGVVEVGIEHTPDSPLNRGDSVNSPLKKGDKGGCLQITISDSGVGIPADRIGKIFDRFYQAPLDRTTLSDQSGKNHYPLGQVDDSQKREHEGTGIGLALTKELVELHGGKISVESALGKGTTFTVSLPLRKAGAGERKPDAGKQITDTESLVANTSSPLKKARPEGIAGQGDRGLSDENGKTISQVQKEKHPPQSPLNRGEGVPPLQFPIILIVEDNPDMRAYIRGHLHEEYKILEAENGKQGFDKAVEKIPDLIISDVMMPVMDGLELCDKIKADERTSHIPFILLTARAESQDKIGGLQSGADDYLVKPFESKELLARVHNLLEQRKRLRERYIREFIITTDGRIPDSLDEKFTSRLIEICQAQMADPGFNAKLLGHEIGLSRSQLHRKLKSVTGQSVTQFINSLRLKRAALLLRQEKNSISQIAYEVGFNNLSYFDKCFKSLFGLSPKEYLQQNSK